VELLWKVLAPNRMALVRALTGAGVVSIREAARRVNRDVRAVHSDVTVLINAGLLNRTEDGIEFPYEAVHVDFMLKAALVGMAQLAILRVIDVDELKSVPHVPVSHPFIIRASLTHHAWRQHCGGLFQTPWRLDYEFAPDRLIRARARKNQAITSMGW
jgi:hypothetical protein